MKYRIQKLHNGWAVIDIMEYKPGWPWDFSGLVCICLYKKGAEEVTKRLNLVA